MPYLLPITGEEPPDDTVVIIRAGVMSSESLRRTAGDRFGDFGAYQVSVEAVLDGLTVVEACQISPRIGDRYGKIRLSTIGRLLARARNARAGLTIIAGTHVLVGCEDADPADAQADGSTELLVHPGAVSEHHGLLQSSG